MKNEDKVKAYLYLNAVLPQLEEVVAFDPEAKETVKGWNCSIQFHVSEGPGVVLRFKDGACKATLGTMALPSVALWFPSPEAVVKQFEKKGFVLPVIWKGLWHPVILSKFIKMTEKIEKYLKPSEADLKDEKFMEFHVKMLLSVAAYGIKAVGENDPKMQEILVRTSNGPMEIKVTNGPVVHIINDKGKITPVKGPATNPTVSMEIGSIPLAYDLLTGNVDFLEALGMCKIRLHGMLTMAENVAVLLDKISEYLG